jgi:hypothetical protein
MCTYCGCGNPSGPPYGGKTKTHPKLDPNKYPFPLPEIEQTTEKKKKKT